MILFNLYIEKNISLLLMEVTTEEITNTYHILILSQLRLDIFTTIKIRLGSVIG